MTIPRRTAALSLSTDPVALSVNATYRLAQPVASRRETTGAAAPLQHADLARLYPNLFGAGASEETVERISRAARTYAAMVRALRPRSV